MSCRSERCRAALTELESLGTEEWTAQHTQALRDVVEACPTCQVEWRFFQQSILIVSTTTQFLPSPHQSQHMWRTCAAHIRNHPIERGLEPRVIPETAKPENTRSTLSESTPFWKSWFSLQPATGWAALAGAVAVLIGVWFFAPQPESNSAPVVRQAVVAPLPEIQSGNDVETSNVSFRHPPAMASPLVNNHAVMGYRPFSSHVGSSLVSYSANGMAP